MAELLFGAETEYAVAQRGPRKRRPGEEAAGELLQLARERLTHLQDINSSGMYLTNGARFYVDCGTHPEYSTPECTDPWELVRQVEAGHQILAGLAREASSGGRRDNGISCFRTNVDYSGSCSTWGSHESYLMRNAIPALAMQLIPHLVTRPIYAGAGGFHPRSRGLEFTLAPRLTYFEQVLGDSTTAGRGIWNEKGESLSERFHRLHVTCGESLCSQTALLLKFGVTALIVAMADAGLEPGAAVQLRVPPLALQTVIGDVRCKAQLEMGERRTRTAIEIQRHYLDMAETHVGADYMPRWAGEVCHHWRAILDRLEAGPEAVAGTLDWAIKFSLYAHQARSLGIRWEALAALNSLLDQTDEEAGPADDPASPPSSEGELQSRQEPGWESDQLEVLARKQGFEVADLKRLISRRERMFEVDTRFGELGPKGIFAALDKAGVLEHRMVADDEVERAMTQPPAGGRAQVRGGEVQRLAGSTDVKCDWQQIVDFAEGKVLDLNDPFATEASWGAENLTVICPGRNGVFDLQAWRTERHPLMRRERAFELYQRGDYRGAEELLRTCLADNFEVASNRCHLARVMMMMDREPEAKEEIVLAWAAREGCSNYVVPRILFFQCLFAMLDGQDPSCFIDSIRQAIQDGDACSNWTIRPMLTHLRPRLGRRRCRFLKALADALSDPDRIASLDKFPQWRSLWTEVNVPS